MRTNIISSGDPKLPATPSNPAFQPVEGPPQIATDCWQPGGRAPAAMRGGALAGVPLPLPPNANRAGNASPASVPPEMSPVELVRAAMQAAGPGELPHIECSYERRPSDVGQAYLLCRAVSLDGTVREDRLLEDLLKARSRYFSNILAGPMMADRQPVPEGYWRVVTLPEDAAALLRWLGDPSVQPDPQALDELLTPQTAAGVRSVGAAVLESNAVMERVDAYVQQQVADASNGSYGLERVDIVHGLLSSEHAARPEFLETVFNNVFDARAIAEAAAKKGLPVAVVRALFMHSALRPAALGRWLIAIAAFNRKERLLGKSVPEQSVALAEDAGDSFRAFLQDTGLNQTLCLTELSRDDLWDHIDPTRVFTDAQAVALTRFLKQAVLLTKQPEQLVKHHAELGLTDIPEMGLPVVLAWDIVPDSAPAVVHGAALVLEKGTDDVAPDKVADLVAEVPDVHQWALGAVSAFRWQPLSEDWIRRLMPPYGAGVELPLMTGIVSGPFKIAGATVRWVLHTVQNEAERAAGHLRLYCEAIDDADAAPNHALTLRFERRTGHRRVDRWQGSARLRPGAWGELNGRGGPCESIVLPPFEAGGALMTAPFGGGRAQDWVLRTSVGSET